MSLRLSPFPHLVLDGYASPAELAGVAATWPGDDWPGWVRYDPRIEGKRASDLATPLPVACAALLARMAAERLGWSLGMAGAVADLSLHGGGLHEMQAGDSLGLHLDADTHPRLGLARAWSAVLYLDYAAPAGGELLLCDDRRQVVERVAPTPGRLVAFDCRDGWHAVAECRARRRSLALFGYLPLPAGGGRPRARFAPWPGVSDGLDPLRDSRARKAA